MSEDEVAALQLAAPYDPAGQLLLAARLVEVLAEVSADEDGTRDALRQVLAEAGTAAGADTPEFRTAVHLLRVEFNAVLQRRDDQYRLLLDAVADIAAQREFRPLLDGVADRTRRLLRADVVYLWLLDQPGAASYLGATSGGMSSELLELQVPAGQGMTGRIIETGMPLIVSQYRTESAFNHFPQIDQVMEREGIQAAVGVPLIHESKTLGTLIAANRDQRTYSMADLVALRSLANHAAIAIERSCAFARTVETMQTVEAENRDLLRRTYDQQRTSTAQRTLSELLLSGADINALVEHANQTLGGHLSVFDSCGRHLAGADIEPAQELPGRLVTEVQESRGIAVQHGVAALPVMASDVLLGVLCFQAGDSLGLVGRAHIEMLEHIATVAGFHLMLAEAEAGAAGFSRDDFIDDLLSGEDTPNLMLRGDRLRIDLRQQFTVHIVRAPIQQRRLALIADDAAKLSNGLAGQCHSLQRGGRPPVVALIPGADAAANSRRLAAAFERLAMVSPTVGGSGPPGSLSAVREVCLQAVTCTDALDTISGGAGSIDELGFVGMVLGDKPDIDHFVSRTLGPVLSYDRAHNATLFETLEALTVTLGAPTAAAEALHLHVSTVKQRMQRITALLGGRWRTADGIAELRIAIKLHKIRLRQENGATP